MRASRMPSSSPVMTVPTVRPRSAGAARVAAYGTTTWAATDASPVSAVPTSSSVPLGALAVTVRKTAVAAHSPTASFRRSTRSPSGTSSSSPSP